MRSSRRLNIAFGRAENQEREECRGLEISGLPKAMKKNVVSALGCAECAYAHTFEVNWPGDML
jgi:hypothetical protein